MLARRLLNCWGASVDGQILERSRAFVQRRIKIGAVVGHRRRAPSADSSIKHHAMRARRVLDCRGGFIYGAIQGGLEQSVREVYLILIRALF